MKQYKLDFEKFVRDLEKRTQEKREENEKLQEQEEQNYSRKIIKLYREKPQNSIRYGKNKNVSE